MLHNKNIHFSDAGPAANARKNSEEIISKLLDSGDWRQMFSYLVQDGTTQERRIMRTTKKIMDAATANGLPSLAAATPVLAKRVVDLWRRCDVENNDSHVDSSPDEDEYHFGVPSGVAKREGADGVDAECFEVHEPFIRANLERLREILLILDSGTSRTEPIDLASPQENPAPRKYTSLTEFINDKKTGWHLLFVKQGKSKTQKWLHINGDSIYFVDSRAPRATTEIKLFDNGYATVGRDCAVKVCSVWGRHQHTISTIGKLLAKPDSITKFFVKMFGRGYNSTSSVSLPRLMLPFAFGRHLLELDFERAWFAILRREVAKCVSECASEQAVLGPSTVFIDDFLENKPQWVKAVADAYSIPSVEANFVLASQLMAARVGPVDTHEKVRLPGRYVKNVVFKKRNLMPQLLCLRAEIDSSVDFLAAHSEPYKVIANAKEGVNSTAVFLGDCERRATRELMSLLPYGSLTYRYDSALVYGKMSEHETANPSQDAAAPGVVDAKIDELPTHIQDIKLQRKHLDFCPPVEIHYIFQVLFAGANIAPVVAPEGDCLAFSRDALGWDFPSGNTLSCWPTDVQVFEHEKIKRSGLLIYRHQNLKEGHAMAVTDVADGKSKLRCSEYTSPLLVSTGTLERIMRLCKEWVAFVTLSDVEGAAGRLRSEFFNLPLAGNSSSDSEP